MIRRLVDSVVSALALILLSPLFLIVSVAVLVDSPGPVIYRSRRAGQNGRAFWMYKFRSMTADAGGRRPSITAKGDARVTRVGRFLRASKLDEFPQFWNVLKGEMTLIGPRPEAIELVDLYSVEQRSILSVKPGLTGPSQISCTLDTSMAVLDSQAPDEYYIKHVLPRRLAMDTEYIRAQSVAQDLGLLARTLGLVLRAVWRGVAKTTEIHSARSGTQAGETQR